MPEGDLSQLSLDTIKISCQKAQVSPMSKDEGHCFELFRRAVDQKSDDAWVAIEAQFQRMVTGWLRQFAHLWAFFSLSQETIDAMWVKTFSRFWEYLHHKKPLARYFANLGKILQFWKACAKTTVREHKNNIERQKRLKEAFEQPTVLALWQDSSMTDAWEQDVFLDCVRGIIENCVAEANADEQLVFHLAYQIGITPKEIAVQHPDRFENARQIGRIKENLVKRIRRRVQASITKCI